MGKTHLLRLFPDFVVVDDSPDFSFPRSFSLASSSLLAVPVLISAKWVRGAWEITQSYEHALCPELVWQFDLRLAFQLQLVQSADLCELLRPRVPRDVRPC